MTPLLPVDEAIARIVTGVEPTLPDSVAIDAADGRTLARDLVARRTQPPFAASSMDGYALRSADTLSPPVTLKLVGASVAGKGFSGSVAPGQAVRIFTGAPVPEGADAVLLQENVEASGDAITIREAVAAGRSIRKAGLDFREGEALIPAGTTLRMREMSLAAAMGHGEVAVHCRPVVAILSTGDELVMPGQLPGPDQIVAASAVGLAAYARSLGADVHDIGIAGDTPEALSNAIKTATAANADVLVTLGGASVGDHDLVGAVLRDHGMALDFWRIAMRPGKPLMFGRLPQGDRAVSVLGLPGNPVSSLVCAILFLRPLLDALLGRPSRDLEENGVLAVDVPENDGRRDYVRAIFQPGSGLPSVTPLLVQDSSMLSTLARANCLLVREIRAPAAKAGAACRIICLP